MTRLLLTAAVLAAAASFAGTARAAYPCGTDAAATVAASTTVDRGNAWSSQGQPDLWEVTFPNGDSVDLYATDATDADSQATTFLANEVSQACAAQQQASAPASDGTTSTTSATTTSAPAGDTSGIATTTYVGDAWGPVPIWRVTYNDGNSVDVAAADAASAVAAVAPTNASPTPNPAPATTAPSAPVTSGQTFTQGTLTPPANDPVSPAAQFSLLNG